LQSENAATLDLANWTKLAKIGSTNAVSGLSQIVNREFKITALRIDEVSLRNAANLIGKSEDRVVGIYLLFSGNTCGQILLMFDPKTAYELVDLAMGVEVGSTSYLGEIERSVLGEVGNVFGKFFLNGVADWFGLRLMPSPPVVVEDMAGAIIGSVLAKAFDETESLFVIKLLFGSTAQEIEGRFLVLPSLAKNSESIK
jgi:chemotaxis protein CheC